jgi:glycosyltransferase involved in cell wall biosynthesis
MLPLNILHRALCNPATLDGGVLRTEQIRGILTKAGEVTRFDNLQIRADWKRYRLGALQTWAGALQALSFSKRRGFPIKDSFMTALRSGLRAGNLPAADVYALDHPIQIMEIPPRLRHRSVIFPHNLEILALAQAFGVSSNRVLSLAKAMGGDVELLSKAGRVVVISREEQWMLSNLGVSSIYLPYLPKPIRRRELAAIRDKRMNQKKESVLIIGTAVNLPTLHGIRSLVETVLKSGLKEKCIVIGKGTDGLRSYFNSDMVEFMGFVSSEELMRQQIRCKALFVHQPFGTGVLTRVVEAVCSGIPVVTNPLGGRSYAGTEGVHIANNYVDGLQEAEKQWPDFVLPESCCASLEAEECYGAGQVLEFLKHL